MGAEDRVKIHLVRVQPFENYFRDANQIIENIRKRGCGSVDACEAAIVYGHLIVEEARRSAANEELDFMSMALLLINYPEVAVVLGHSEGSVIHIKDIVRERITRIRALREDPQWYARAQYIGALCSSLLTAVYSEADQGELIEDVVDRGMAIYLGWADRDPDLPDYIGSLEGLLSTFECYVIGNALYNLLARDRRTG